MPVHGIGPHAYVDLERYLDVRTLESLDDEITFSLAQVPFTYTGGSHRTMGIVPPSQRDEPWVDYGEVLASMTRREFTELLSLGEGGFDPSRWREYELGEEKEHPLTMRQMLFLKLRFGVYFPWQVFYEMIPTKSWDDKSNGEGKDFTDEAKRFFPRLVAFVKSLPFEQIGRCNILGLEAYHHGTIHQDGDLEDPRADHFITLCPKKNKRLFLWDEERRAKTFVVSRAYWFNDHGYHGVEADPFFRYSIRVDGVFRPDFLARLEREWNL